jgi:hypothetical protein
MLILEVAAGVVLGGVVLLLLFCWFASYAEG